VSLGAEALDHTVDGRDRHGELLLGTPCSPQTLVVRTGPGHEIAIAEIDQCRIINLHDVDSGLHQRPGLASQDLGQVFEKMLHGRVGLAAVVNVPVAQGDQERARQGKLGHPIGVTGQERRILGKDRLRGGDAADDDVGVLHLTLMLVTAAFLKTADPPQQLADVLFAPPFAVADHVHARLFLKPDGKQNEIIHDAGQATPIHLLAAGQDAEQGLRPRQRPDWMSEKRRQLGSAICLQADTLLSRKDTE